MVEIPGEIRGIRAVPEMGVMCDIGTQSALDTQEPPGVKIPLPGSTFTRQKKQKTHPRHQKAGGLLLCSC